MKKISSDKEDLIALVYGYSNGNLEKAVKMLANDLSEYTPKQKKEIIIECWIKYKKIANKNDIKYEDSKIYNPTKKHIF